MDCTNKDLLKNNKNVINAAVINRVNKVPNEWHTMNWFQDSYFNLNIEGHADLWVWGTRKMGYLLFVPITSCVDFVSTNFFFYFAEKRWSTRRLLLPKDTSRLLGSSPCLKKKPSCCLPRVNKRPGAKSNHYGIPYKLRGKIS